MIEPRLVAATSPAGRPIDDGEYHGADGQLHGGGKEFDKLRDDRFVGNERSAEITLKNIAHIDEVLLPNRLVEPENGEKLGMPLGRDTALAGQGFNRISGKHTDEAERHQSDAEKDRHQDGQAVQEKQEHGTGRGKSKLVGKKNGGREAAPPAISILMPDSPIANLPA